MSSSTTAPTATMSRTRALLGNFAFQIVAALVLGVALGWAALALGPVHAADGTPSPNWLATTLSTIGSSFITLLRAIVPPLIFTAIVASIANLQNVANGARLAWKTIQWFAITALVSVLIGIGLGLVLQPGRHTSLTTDDSFELGRAGSWLDFLQGLIPGNILGIGAGTSLDRAADGSVAGAETSISFNVLQILVVALVVGIAVLRTGRKADPFLTFIRSALAIVQTVLWWIIRLAPLGTLGLVGTAVASYGWDSLASLGRFAIAIYTGLALVLFVVYPVILRANGLSVGRWFRGAWPAIQLAFVSRSSIGTLPVAQRVTERNLGVPAEYASFAVPLASTTKMDGCASIYPAVAAIFVAQIYGVDLSVLDYLLIAFVSVVGSAATAGLTGALVMLTLTLSTVGLPLAGVGLLLAIDPILDMGRTAVNVAGQVLVPTIVAKREGILDRKRYDDADAEDLFAEIPETASEAGGHATGEATGEAAAQAAGEAETQAASDDAGGAPQPVGARG